MTDPLTRRRFLQSAIASGVAVGSGAALGKRAHAVSTASKSGERPNLLFVMSDQWRWHAMGYLGLDPVLTPNVDRFARTATDFTNSFTAIPICGPNRSCILSGRLPQSTGNWTNEALLPTDGQSLPSRLKAAGYRTGYIGKWHLDGNLHHNNPVPVERRHGLDLFAMPFSGHRHFEIDYQVNDDRDTQDDPAWQVTYETDMGLGFLRDHANADEPFALMLSYSPPHGGYGATYGDRRRNPTKSDVRGGFKAPAEFEALYPDMANAKRPPNFRKMRTWDDERLLSDPFEIAGPGYFGACSSIDHEFGRLLDELDRLGVADNTVVVFTSDHGEMLGSHGRMAKGVPFEESIHVPFLVRDPRGGQAGEVDRLMSSIDMAPTMLSLLGLTPPTVMDGFDFTPIIRGGSADSPDSVLIGFDRGASHERWTRAFRQVRTADRSYAIGQAPQYRALLGEQRRAMWDVANDPYQLECMEPGMGRDAEMDDLHDRLAALLDRHNDRYIDERWHHTEAG
ncbi:MAG: sulfatase [Planctomycetota bacterium]